MTQRYFSENYFMPWFAKHYFIISIIAPTAKPNRTSTGGSYLLSNEQLFPNDVMPKEFQIQHHELLAQLPETIKEIQASLNDDDDEEAIVLIQIISELPHAFTEQKLISITKDQDVIELISSIADQFYKTEDIE